MKSETCTKSEAQNLWRQTNQLLSRKIARKKKRFMWLWWTGDHKIQLIFIYKQSMDSIYEVREKLFHSSSVYLNKKFICLSVCLCTTCTCGCSESNLGCLEVQQMLLNVNQLCFLFYKNMHLCEGCFCWNFDIWSASGHSSKSVIEPGSCGLKFIF